MAPGLTATQAINDLVWTLSSPSLVVDDLAVSQIMLEPGLVKGGDLLDFLAARPVRRVGRYFENLLAFWLEYVRGVEMIGQGIQIRDGKKTVGELDFLFRDEDGLLNHWEAAVKFFLYLPNNIGSNFPGPNASDNFELKTDKLFTQQLTVSETHYPDIEIRRAFVRGQIFYHPSIGQPDSLPERLAPDHLRGHWIRHSQLDWLEDLGRTTGHIAHKPFWFTPLADSEPLRMTELRKELKHHFAVASHPVMVCVLNQTGDSEVDRVFVVPDTWPDRVSFNSSSNNSVA